MDSIMSLKKNEEPFVRITMVQDVEIRHLQFPKGEIQRIYKFKGKIIPRIPLAGHYIDQHNSLDLIDKDLRNIIEWLALAKEVFESLDEIKHFQEPDLKKNLLLKSLFVSIVTIYGKCFTEAKGRRFMLERKHVPEEYKYLHDYLMDTRHNFAAHKGIYAFDTSELCLIISGTKKNPDMKLYSERNQINYKMDAGEIEKCQELCGHLRGFLKNKIENLIEKIFAEKINTKPYSYWISRKDKITTV